MVTIRETTAEDFDQVYPLLRGFEAPYLTEDHWRQLFIDHSGCQAGRFGYVLVDDGKIVGTIALTFSERTFRGQKHRLCNMSNWIVKSEYRGRSLMLLAKVVALEGVTLTALSPTAEVLRMCKKLGFQTLGLSQRIVLPILDPRRLVERCEILTDLAEVEARLDGPARRICRDHRLPHHRHLLVRSAMGDCHVMLNRSLKHAGRGVRVPMARVHHVSAPEIFRRHLDRIAVAAAISFRAVALVVDERVLGGHAPWHSFARPGGEYLGAFRSKDGVLPEDIDGLYSECVLLNY